MLEWIMIWMLHVCVLVALVCLILEWGYPFHFTHFSFSTTLTSFSYPPSRFPFFFSFLCLFHPHRSGKSIELARGGRMRAGNMAQTEGLPVANLAPFAPWRLSAQCLPHVATLLGALAQTLRIVRPRNQLKMEGASTICSAQQRMVVWTA
jgi:hypothetical protein